MLLSDGHALVTDFGVAKAVNEAKGATRVAEEAVRLDPESAEAHTSLAAIRWWYERDWDGAGPADGRDSRVNVASQAQREHGFVIEDFESLQYEF